MNSSYSNVFGVDVAKDKLDIHDASRASHVSIANEPKQIAQWLRKAKRRKGVLVVMEATGGYEQVLVDLLHEAKVDVAVCNPY